MPLPRSMRTSSTMASARPAHSTTPRRADGSTAVSSARAIATARAASKPSNVLTADQFRRAARQRAGLVEDHATDAREPFEHVRAGDQKAATAQRQRRDGDRGRSRQRQRAGARDDKHRDRGGKRFRRIREVPEHERRQRRWQAPRATKWRAIASACTATAGLSSAARCASRWMSATRVCAGARRCDDGDRLRDVQRAGEHAHADGLRDEPRLAGQRRFVDLRRAVDDVAVDRRSASPMERRCGRRRGSRRAAPFRRAPFDSRRADSGSSASQSSLRTRRRRACCSRYRAPSSRKTNIVTESK